ncbi:ankyrin repeat domain-containing protein 26 [Hyalella azteca]|uniref:Ankyrin repeat domain-containing protein 26 n=1 Tax=Hyalella azteca TaxID=294128 RepID=A0A979FIZ7_HYAAZ|nr:ankyrin repeat domain-containing protein 26 [Hyalella azteca]
MNELEASYPPEPLHAVPQFANSDEMTAAVARANEQRRAAGRGQQEQQEVLDLRTGAGGVTPLMTACQEGHERTVRQILQMKPSMVHDRDRTGKTALHYCTDNPTLACIDQVVAADPRLLSAREEDGHTPLHLATIAGNRVVAKYLLTRGADINALDDEKHTAIHWATVCGEVQLLEMLMEAGGDPSTADIHGAYPIHYAAQMCGPNGDPSRDMSRGLEVLKTLIQYGVPVDVKDKDGREPMLWAASSEVLPSHVYCSSGSADAIMILKKAGASVVAADKDGLTALHCAASRGHLDCIDMLITLCNCEVDLLDSNGCSPLFYSVTLGHADCTHILLNNGADANRQDRKGRTPAHCGAAKGQLETLKLLHQHQADLWKRNVKGDLPLHEACQSGRKDLVVWLLSMMTEMVNASNSDGRTPLHIAAINNNTGLCKILMDHNAAVNPIMRNSKGQLLTPVDAAVARGHKGCAQFLQLHGATSAAKLTDKRALQLALSNRAMEGGSGDRTGATPNSELGYQDLLIPSSATPGTRTQDASTLMAAQLKDMGTDTQTTSEINIQELVVQEPQMAKVVHEARAQYIKRKQEQQTRQEVHQAMVHQSQSAQLSDDEKQQVMNGSEVQKSDAEQVKDENNEQGDSEAEIQYDGSNGAPSDEEAYSDDFEDDQLPEDMPIKEKPKSIFALSKSDEEKLEAQNKRLAMLKKEKSLKRSKESKKVKADRAKSLESKPRRHHRGENVLSHAQSAREITEVGGVEPSPAEMNLREQQLDPDTKTSHSRQDASEKSKHSDKTRNSKQQEILKTSTDHSTVFHEQPTHTQHKTHSSNKQFKNPATEARKMSTEKCQTSIEQNTNSDAQVSEKSKKLRHMETTDLITENKVTPLVDGKEQSSDAQGTGYPNVLENSKFEATDTIDMVDSMVLGEKEEYSLKSIENSIKTDTLENAVGIKEIGQAMTGEVPTSAIGPEKPEKDKKCSSKSRSSKHSSSKERKHRLIEDTVVTESPNVAAYFKEGSDSHSAKSDSRKRFSREGHKDSTKHENKITQEAEQEKAIEENSINYSRGSRSSGRSGTREKLEPEVEVKLEGENGTAAVPKLEEDTATRSSGKSRSSKRSSSKASERGGCNRSRSASRSKPDQVEEKDKNSTRSKSSVDEHRKFGSRGKDKPDDEVEVKAEKILKSKSHNSGENITTLEQNENSVPPNSRSLDDKGMQAPSESAQFVKTSENTTKITDPDTREISLIVPQGSVDSKDTSKNESTGQKELAKTSDMNRGSRRVTMSEVTERSNLSESANEKSEGTDSKTFANNTSQKIDQPKLIDIEINGRKFTKVLKTKSAEAEDAALEAMSYKVTRNALGCHRRRNRSRSGAMEETGLQPLRTPIRRVKYSDLPKHHCHGKDVRMHEMHLLGIDMPELSSLSLRDITPRTKKESGYSGSHRGDSELDNLSEDEGDIVSKSAIRRKMRKEKLQAREKETPDYRSDQEETDALSDRQVRKKGGRYNEDGDMYDLDDAYADMDDLPRHLSARRAAKSKGRRHSDGGETGHSSDTNSQKKANRSAPTEMSITQAMQTTMRKYTLERRLFQHLLELKRQQIRNTKVNESVLIKRMSDANNRDSTMLGLRGYAGPMTFQSYEKYLYEQLKFLQNSQGEKIPQFKPMDDVEKLNRVLHRTEIAESKRVVGGGQSNNIAPADDDDATQSDPRSCSRRTHRCHHAAHAYTGVPCAAYLAPRGKKFIERKINNSEGKLSLPRISGASSQAGSGPATYRGKNVKKNTAKSEQMEQPSGAAFMGVQGYDPKKPLTVELQHGGTRQQIALPLELLDKSKRYNLRFSIKVMY